MGVTELTPLALEKYKQDYQHPSSSLGLIYCYKHKYKIFSC